MNYRMSAYVLGKLLGIEGILLLIPTVVSLIYGEYNEALSFVIVTAVLLAIYLFLGRKKPKNTTIYGKDGFVIVAAAWMLMSFFGCLPFVFSGAIPNIVDAFFETVSGFTTTGATILTDVEAVPNGLLFWRSFTHWIGGMGVLVFVMAVVPLADKRSMHLMRAEMPGPTVDKLVPKARVTAKILYQIYIVMSVVLVVLLMFGGMNLFDSLIHTFGTAGTGGFSNRAASVGYYNSPYIDTVIGIFMVLFSINFNLFYLVLLKKALTPILKSEEVKVFLAIIAAATVAIAINIFNYFGGTLQALRYAFFQVTSIISTSGFATTDFNLWPQFSKTIILLLMVVGACAGSTGGGIKISRLILFVKTSIREVKHIFYPQAINVVRLDKKRVEDETLNNLYGYGVAYAAILGLSILLISLDNFDFATNFSSALTCLNNVGPGLGVTGPTGSFAGYSLLSKVVLSFNMLVGRLEIFPFLILFSPSLWRRKF